MSDALYEFAHLAALALRDITDPDATVHAADEALAALEQHVNSLPRDARNAGKLVARCCWQMRAKQTRCDCAAGEALSWLRAAIVWTRIGQDVSDVLCAGKDIERASHIIDAMGREHAELRQLLRAVVAATERLVLECVVERVHGGGHVRAA
jgi:hypothetical protein